ncbi:hypothetical protein FRB98_005170 [Tulasnella sp. 332]|nr:hypothetical protein FRB98_005170 [Tulasnella sp. 332]
MNPAGPQALRAIVDELTVLFLDIQASRYLSAAGFFILLYDHLITFSEEVELIWKGPLSLVSFLFLLNRYAVPIIIAVDLYEKSGFARSLSHSILSLAIAHALVAIRVRVLWNNEPRVKTLINVAGAAYLITTLVLTNWIVNGFQPTVGWLSALNLCYAAIPHSAAWIFVPSLLLECLLFGLTVTRAIQHRQRDLSVTTGVVGVLYRDGMLYFLVIAGCAVFNILVWAALRPSLIVLAKFFTFSLITVMASRIVLNLRAQRRDDGELSNPVTSVGSSDYPASFAGRPRRSSHLTVNGGSQDPRCKASVQGGQFVPRSFGSMPSRDRWGSHDNVDIEDARGMTKGKIEEYELQSGGRMPVRINVDVEVDVEVEVVLDTEGDSDGSEKKLARSLS